MPSKHAAVGFTSEKGGNAIKICLNRPHKGKGGKMPSKYATMGFISEKGGKCYQNMH